MRGMRTTPLLTLAVVVMVAIASRSLITFISSPAASSASDRNALRGTQESSRRSTLLGGLAAGAAVAWEAPARADKDQSEFSFFGFGSSTAGVLSDAYARNDADNDNPYNMFSAGKDTNDFDPTDKGKIYQYGNEKILNRKRKEWAESEIRLAALQDKINKKQPEEIKMGLTRQLESLKVDMRYFATLTSTPKASQKKVDEFWEKLDDMKVFAKKRRWQEVQDLYNEALSLLPGIKADLKV